MLASLLHLPGSRQRHPNAALQIVETGDKATGMIVARRGSGTTISHSIRPGPWDITSTRSASTTASSMSWVTNTTVC